MMSCFVSAILWLVFYTFYVNSRNPEKGSSRKIYEVWAAFFMLLAIVAACAGLMGL